MKIFLVEDDPLLIDIYGTKFRNAGFEVENSDNGEKAVGAIMKSDPDAIVLDLVLPHLDGWGVLSALRKQKKLDKVKIMILSNLGQDEEIKKGYDMGANAYLVKAHNTPSQVVEGVRKMLAGKRSSK
ncbi:MAG: response regulator transcription factor [Candidatus Wildermuthbacteria bacterium]|nr:response regulator transcription factor [Candidatus Wildermuthbacteria bacterium]